jgi:hypothetical protein
MIRMMSDVLMHIVKRTDVDMAYDQFATTGDFVVPSESSQSCAFRETQGRTTDSASLDG